MDSQVCPLLAVGLLDSVGWVRLAIWMQTVSQPHHLLHNPTVAHWPVVDLLALVFLKRVDLPVIPTAPTLRMPALSYPQVCYPPAVICQMSWLSSSALDSNVNLR